MNAELSAYRQRRINALINEYRTNVNRLYSGALANIRNIQRSRLSPQSKRMQISNVIASYNTNVRTLVTTTNNNIDIIKNYVPPALKINISMRSLFTNNSQVFYKPHSLSSGGGGSGVRNYRHKQRQT